MLEAMEIVKSYMLDLFKQEWAPMVVQFKEMLDKLTISEKQRV